MSTGQKIRNLAIKIEQLQNELRDLQREHIENKEFQNKQENKTTKLDEARNSKSKMFHIDFIRDDDRDFVISSSKDDVFISHIDYISKMAKYESAIQEIIQQKDEKLNFIKAECTK